MSHYSQGASRALFSRLYRILSHSHLTSLPEGPGIYVLLTIGQIYVGQSGDLKRRVPESQNERRNWGAVYFLAMRTCHDLSLDEREILLRQLEASCISAAFTLIFGHQLPLSLANRQHAKTLPLSVWESRHLVWPPSQRHDVSLGINVVTAILKNAGVPARHCKLPGRKMLASVREMEFSEQWKARRHVLDNPFQPNFISPIQDCTKVKTFNAPLVAANAAPLSSTSQAA